MGSIRNLTWICLALMLTCKKDDAKDQEIAALRAQLAAKSDPPPPSSLGAVRPVVAPAIVPTPAAPPPEEDTPVKRLVNVSTLAAALQITLPLMEDTINKQSDGTIALSIWSTQHLKWSDVGVPRNETSIRLILKDSDAARGKRMCLPGMVVQIHKERGIERLYTGIFGAYYGQGFISYAAVGDTGELVDQSPARFCGIVTGRYTYGNAAGGTTHAVSMVGMFDLPGNNPQKKHRRASSDEDEE